MAAALVRHCCLRPESCRALLRPDDVCAAPVARSSVEPCFALLWLPDPLQTVLCLKAGSLAPSLEAAGLMWRLGPLADQELQSNGAQHLQHSSAYVENDLALPCPTQVVKRKGAHDISQQLLPSQLALCQAGSAPKPKA